MKSHTPKTHAAGILLMVLALCLWVTPTRADEAPISEASTEESIQDYSLDPVLSGGRKAPYAPSPPVEIVIEKKGDQALLGLQSDSKITPYVGAVKGEKVPDDLKPLLDKDQMDPQKNIKLETGVGMSLSEHTNFNLGYRFDKSSSLIEQRGKENNGQFRFGLDFTLPSK